MNEREIRVVGGGAWLTRPAAGYVIVVLLTAASVFWQLDRTILEEHEAKAALAARGMVRAGSWLVQGPTEQPLPPPTTLNRWLIPVNNGEPRLVKTPLPYWVIALLGLMRGDVNEWLARLPSAISAVLCAAVVLAIGRRMFSPRAALLGAVIFATSLGLVKWGRSARPELMLCLLITVAMGSFYAGLSSRGRAGRIGWMIVFWLAMGLANLCKEVFPLLLGLPLAAYLCWRAGRPATNAPAQRDPSRRRLASYGIASVVTFSAAIAVHLIPRLAWWRWLGVDETVGDIATMALAVLLPLAWYAAATGAWREVRPLLPTAIPGAIVMLAMFLPWMWYMHRLFGAGAIFDEQVAERAAGTGVGDRSDPPYYYLNVLVTMTLPWLGLLPGALIVPWLKRFSDRRDGLVYLFLWTAGLGALLTLSVGKREHYLLPALPALSLLMGFVAEDVFFNHRWIRRPLARTIAVAYGVVGLLAPVLMATMYFISIDQDRFVRVFHAFRMAQNPPGPSEWMHMLIVTLVVGAVMGAVLLAAWRRRFALIVPLIAAGVALTYIGFYTRADLWDDRSLISDFAEKARRQIPRTDPVGSYGEPQAKTVFYFGRDIPNVLLTHERLAAKPDGEKLWQQWLADPHNVAWMFGYEHEIEHMPRDGWILDLRKSISQAGKHLVFVVWKRARD